ncbi:heterokaryon incompatibility protein-domain-containing protein [Nemania sp. FL0916]|nr:heterokaryon incompatibility protein-domain-containing protein [Nemania sp. FL0916]
MSPESYSYAPLDHGNRNIRLLHLLPGKLSDPISCSLSHEALDGKPTYTALSYAWGERVDFRCIYLQSIKFPVTHNLYTALEFLRKVDVERILWIDAICINQKSNVEKGYQVSLMGEIYKNAQQVFCWLGSPDENGVVNTQGDLVNFLNLIPTSHSPRFVMKENVFSTLTSRFGGPTSPEVQNTQAAIKLLAKLGNLMEYGHPMDSGVFADGSCGSCPSCKIRGRHVEIAPSYKGAFEVFSRWIRSAWWDRVWTVQEACLAAESWIIAYHIMIPFKLLRNARDWVNIHANTCCRMSMSSLQDPEFVVFNRFMRKVKEISPIEPLYLSHFLRQFRSRKATDPRDKVYALLGMSIWTRGAPLQPDYQLELEQVYINTMMKIIEEINSLDILQGVLRPTMFPNLPSWVHDWTIEDEKDDGFRGDSSLYSAGGELSKAELCCKTELLVDGFAVGQVTSVGPICNVDDDAAVFDTLKIWEEMISTNGLSPDEPYLNGQSRSDAFRSAMGGDVVRTRRYLTRWLGSSPRHYFRSEENDKELCRDWWGLVAGDETQTAEVTNAWYQHFITVILETVKNTRFFLTDQGLMGIGPPWMEVGDTVSVLRGSGLPYILRDANSQKSTREGCFHLERLCFNLVGSAYIHGIMDGEVLKDRTKTQVEIHLC